MTSAYTSLTGDRGILQLNHIDGGALPYWYCAADVVLHPSFVEGFSYVLFESWSCGTPVLLSDIPVHREGAASYFWGCNALDAARLAAEIEHLNSGDIEFDSSKLRQRVTSRFTFDRFRDAYLRLWTQVGL